jgi:hypothetical protein
LSIGWFATPLRRPFVRRLLDGFVSVRFWGKDKGDGEIPLTASADLSIFSLSINLADRHWPYLAVGNRLLVTRFPRQTSVSHLRLALQVQVKLQTGEPGHALSSPEVFPIGTSCDFLCVYYSTDLFLGGHNLV